MEGRRVGLIPKIAHIQSSLPLPSPPPSLNTPAHKPKERREEKRRGGEECVGFFQNRKAAAAAAGFRSWVTGGRPARPRGRLGGWRPGGRPGTPVTRRPGRLPGPPGAPGRVGSPAKSAGDGGNTGDRGKNKERRAFLHRLLLLLSSMLFGLLLLPLPSHVHIRLPSCGFFGRKNSWVADWKMKRRRKRERERKRERRALLPSDGRRMR